MEDDARAAPLNPAGSYSEPLREMAPPRDGKVRVQFDCPRCGEILVRLAELDQTRWYIPSCNLGHSGIGVHDPRVNRIKAY